MGEEEVVEGLGQGGGVGAGTAAWLLTAFGWAMAIGTPRSPDCCATAA